ncbi:hypothetical protein GPECTOR_7g1015 [Gonium pectorale]|uniref:Right handed beta helix domain-containing protein n=1 Tax=Gonium pectorale TaxID=33097 RepID=A0A150GTL8_GONPE|nr:hypothetical protein GPECTOR_7g1015 [Gonium pectorale]|eukprot:KXZ53124.1 hypothetical protein GPECTOR_7g1015 [Gonium pectorale]
MPIPMTSISRHSRAQLMAASGGPPLAASLSSPFQTPTSARGGPLRSSTSFSRPESARPERARSSPTLAGRAARPRSARAAEGSEPASASTSGGGAAASAATGGGNGNLSSGGGSVLMHFMRASAGAVVASNLTTASSAPLLFRSMAAARTAQSPARHSSSATPPLEAAAAALAGRGPGPLSAGPMRRAPGADASAAAAVAESATPGSLRELLLQRVAAARSRPASAGGNLTSRAPAGSSSTTAAGSGAAAAAAARGARPPAFVAGFDPGPERRRGPAALLDLQGLGPDETDIGYLVDASDLLLAGGPASPVVSVAPDGPPPGPYANAGPDKDDEDEAASGPPSPAMQLIHVPLPQHVLLSGSLQDLYERIGRSGDRPLHFSLGAVTFSGDLDPALNDMIRIQNRIVILHNCTLVLRPGQKFWVGDMGHLILADVNIYCSTTSPNQPAAAGGGTAGQGSGSGGAKPSVTFVSPPTSPPLSASPRRPVTASRFGAGGGAGSSGGAPAASAAAITSPVPLLHVAAGGRMLLRGCRVKILAPGQPIPTAANGSPGAAPPGAAGHQARSPRSPRTAVRGHAPPSSTFHSSSSTAGGSAALGSVVCVSAEAGAIVEAVGCRLGRMLASGADTSLTLRRCRVKPGKACAADAPLLHAADGASLCVSSTLIRSGPAVGISTAGPADTRVDITQSAVTQCGSHGCLIMSGADLAATFCRVADNGAGGLAVRGAGAAAELADCELTGNRASNVWVSNGGTVRLTACSALGSGEGCGLNVEGKDSRATAEGCAFDGNGASGVRVRSNAELDLRDSSASGNALHGVDVEGTWDAADNAERVAQAVLINDIPPPPPLPDIFVIVAGGQLAKNGRHGCRVTSGGGLRVTGSEISQNGEDGAYSDGPGCELLLDGCRIVRNTDNGVFICSGAAVWLDACRLGGNLLGHMAVGGRGSRGRLTRCTFEYSPVTALRVQMGAKVALRECEMESAPAAALPGTARPQSRSFYNVDELRRRSSSTSGSGGDILDCQAWEVGSIRSKYVKLMGQGSLLSVDGRAIFSTVGDDGQPLGS